ncbi:MAG: TIGR00266 family protein [Candidatus Nanohaloarchaeota archaeon]|nr:TIGR00266 family protein [Candidatus Nanohaloarchaeota archaeon]
MDWKIIDAESFDYVEVDLKAGERIRIQPGSYFMHKGEVEVNPKAVGGIGTSLKRMFLGGESFFINEFTAVSSAKLYLAPSMPGQIKTVELNNQQLIVKDGGYLASTADIDISTKFVGLKGLFTRSGFFWINLSGTGKALINTYGALLEIEVKENEKIYVDNTHLIAYEPSINIAIKKLGNLKTFFFGGEGIVFEITGKGKIYLQTRNIYHLQSIILRSQSK